MQINDLRELLAKAAHLALREGGWPPEVWQSRKLAKFSLASAKTAQAPHSAEARILIWTVRDWSVHVQLEAVLGQVLRARGADVSFATCGGGLEICDRVNTWEGPPMPCRSCSKYVSTSLAAHGFDPIELSAMWEEGSWPELDLLDLVELRNAEWNGLPLGRLVDIPVKWFLMGESIDRDPLGASTYRAFLRSARRIAEAAEKVLDRALPDQVVLLNGLFLFEAIVAELCRRRGVSVVTYERALMLDTFVFARDDIAGFYRVDADWARLADVPLTSTERDEVLSHFTQRRSGAGVSDNYWRDVRHTNGFTEGPKTRAVLFTNLVWDSAVIGQDVAFDSIVDWIVAAVQNFGQRPEAELVIRIHPAEVKLSGRESREQMQHALLSRLPRLPANVRVIPPEDATSSYDLMEQADFGLVYSSTTGLEMALLGKPVIVAAHTHYRGKGFTVDAASPDGFASAVDDQCNPATRFKPDVELAERYAHLLLFKAAYTDLGVTEPIRGLCRVSADDVMAVASDGTSDLNRVIETILDRTDFRVSQH